MDVYLAVLLVIAYLLILGCLIAGTVIAVNILHEIQKTALSSAEAASATSELATDFTNVKNTITAIYQFVITKFG
jgi:hypothetical protein